MAVTAAGMPEESRALEIKSRTYLANPSRKPSISNPADPSAMNATINTTASQTLRRLSKLNTAVNAADYRQHGDRGQHDDDGQLERVAVGGPEHFGHPVRDLQPEATDRAHRSVSLPRRCR